MSVSTPMPKQQDAQRLEAASDWLQRLHAAPQDEDLLGEWLQWCAEPENQDAFERVRAVWQALDAPELQPVVERTRRSLVEPASRARRRRWLWPAALAAGIAVCLIVPLWPMLYPAGEAPTRSFVTALAENKSELLPDGSRIELGARSRVDVHFTETRREVTIAAGEAFFIVAKDASRPFVVMAGAVKVTAVGTQFNVRRGQDNTIVTVSEGRVNVESAEIARASTKEASPPLALVSAGQQVRYSASARSLTIVHVDPELASSWRQGVLKFVDEPLGSVVAHINRYSARQIVITDPQLAQRSYTGTVHDAQIDEWLVGLERIYPMRVVSDGADTVTLEPAQRPVAAVPAS